MNPGTHSSSAAPYSQAQACELLQQGYHVPLFVEVAGAQHTPQSLLLQLDCSSTCFVLEGFGWHDSGGPCSLVGVGNPRMLELKQHQLTGWLASGECVPLDTTDPFGAARTVLGSFRVAPAPGVHPAWGGVVGYFSYEVARSYEALEEPPRPALHVPDVLLLLASPALLFDHERDVVQVIVLAEPPRAAEPAIEAWLRAQAVLKHWARVLAVPSTPEAKSGYDQGGVEPLRSSPPAERGSGQGSRPAASPRLGGAEEPLADEGSPGPLARGPWASGLDLAPGTAERFEQAVHVVKQHIVAGDIFQAVLSHRQEVRTRASGLAIYSALRELNPAAYLFYLRVPELELIGASPETLVRLRGREALTHPIAGTRRRGQTPAEDTALAVALAEDPKERAEHLMLVDLARNDLGRVCDYGSIRVEPYMQTRRYSHVMHLVSQVLGTLRPEHDGLSLLQACLPAGTLSGAPKLKAMSIIDQLEPVRRGIYGGAFGMLGFDGSLDTCIAIRTLVKLGERVYLQAGAGIVADSQPPAELAETLDKMRVLLVALERAAALEPTP
jgi:anthranilate synthase component I